MLKKYTGQVIQWFTKSYGLRIGQGHFPGWVIKVDCACFSLTDPYLSGIEESEFSLSDIIDWKDLNGVPSFANGNAAAIKKNSGVCSHLGFIKIFVERGFVAINKNPDDFLSEAAKTMKESDNEISKARNCINNSLDRSLTVDGNKPSTSKVVVRRRLGNVVTKRKNDIYVNDTNDKNENIEE